LILEKQIIYLAGLS